MHFIADVCLPIVTICCLRRQLFLQAGIHMRDGAITKFSRKAKVTNAVPTLHKGFAIALAGALCAAAMVVTIWVVLLRKRGDEWEDDGTWNPDKVRLLWCWKGGRGVLGSLVGWLHTSPLLLHGVY